MDKSKEKPLGWLVIDWDDKVIPSGFGDEKHHKLYQRERPAQDHAEKWGGFVVAVYLSKCEEVSK